MNKIVLSTEQRQGISQQAIQIVEILQMSVQELDAYLNELVLTNPLIDPDASYQNDDEPLQVRVSEDDGWEDGPAPGRQGPDQLGGMQVPQAPLSVPEQLFLQLLPHVRTPGDECILRYLIDSLDERGYLTEENDRLCQKLGVGPETLEGYVRILQQLEPAGLGARSLQECLLLQLRRLDTPDAALAGEIVRDHFQDMAEGRARQLARKLHVREEAVQQAMNTIQRLNPRPASGLDTDATTVYIQPDILVERDAAGFQIRLRQPHIHRLVADAGYLALAQEGAPELKAYIREKKQGIDWINRCLEQREATLTRLAVQIGRAHV